jgi:hypothetical protein
VGEYVKAFPSEGSDIVQKHVKEWRAGKVLNNVWLKSIGNGVSQIDAFRIARCIHDRLDTIFVSGSS